MHNQTPCDIRRFAIPCLVAAGLALVCPTASYAGVELADTPAAHAPAYPDVSAQAEQARNVVPAEGPKSRGAAALTKLDPELRMLVGYQTARGRLSADDRTLRNSLLRSLGATGTPAAPRLQLAVHLSAGATVAGMKKAGAVVELRQGNLVFLSAPASALAQLAALPGVSAVVPVKPKHIPVRPRLSGLQASPAARGPAPPPAGGFDRQGLTGKGVIFAVIDSGIDWRHPDFINADGSSRILYLYDMTDNSWTASHGSIGSKPPLPDENGKPLGTLYTAAQITAALKGTGTVNSYNYHPTGKDIPEGHGTACAGTAAGNGRAPGHVMGVAPEADLIVVHWDFTTPENVLADWVFRTAEALKKPCVISMSFGSQNSVHLGTDADEQSLDMMVGAGHPGRAICVSSGNERQENLHAGGRFGPRLDVAGAATGTGGLFVESDPVELFVPPVKRANGDDGAAIVNAFFDHADDWGLAVLGVVPGATLLVMHQEDATGAYHYAVEDPDTGKVQPVSPQDEQTLRERLPVGPDGDNPSQDKVTIGVPSGHDYLLYAFGQTSHVTDGRYDLYLVNTDDEEHTIGSFGKGVDQQYLVCSPGNADNVITVGSYDFQKQWLAQGGKQMGANLELGALSSFSSPGYRRDRTVKPEITAPGQFMISAFAQGSDMDEGVPDYLLTQDGYHVAWRGTSAACPYVAGVVALMLEKDPTLDSDQIKHILTSTAKTDDDTGAVPNAEWGYGKLNPVAALQATPEGTAR